MRSEIDSLVMLFLLDGHTFLLLDNRFFLCPELSFSLMLPGFEDIATHDREASGGCRICLNMLCIDCEKAFLFQIP